MEFLNGLEPTFDLTYDDVFMIPSRSAVGSRLAVDLATDDATGTTIPLVVANMTAVAGKRMAETVARRGAMAIIPQDIPIDVVGDTVARVKASHRLYDTPVTVKPHHTCGYALGLIPKRAHGAAIVVDPDTNVPVGIVDASDVSDVDRFTQVREVMSTELVTLPEGVDPRETFDPPGVAAADLTESLMLQLMRLPASPARQAAAHLIQSSLHDLGKNRKQNIIRFRKLFPEIDSETIEAALDIIATLNPYPAYGFASSEPTAYIQPDVWVKEGKDGWKVIGNEAAWPRNLPAACRAVRPAYLDSPEGAMSLVSQPEATWPRLPGAALRRPSLVSSRPYGTTAAPWRFPTVRPRANGEAVRLSNKDVAWLGSRFWTVSLQVASRTSPKVRNDPGGSR